MPPPRLIFSGLSLIALVAVTCGALVAGSAAAGEVALPAGPRLAVVVLPTGTGDPEIRTIGSTGGDVQTVLTASSPLLERGFERPIWSPDGRQMTFVGSGRKVVGVYLMGADGSGLRRLPNSESPGGEGTVLVSEPVFDPAGETLTVDITNRHNQNSLWSLPVDGSRARRLSSWVGSRYLYPYSMAPDGRLAAQAAGVRGFAVATVAPDGGDLHVLIPANGEGNYDPAVSPDGTRIAYLRDNMRRLKTGNPRLIRIQLMVMPIGGGKSRRLATIHGGALWTSWDPSGSRISFTAQDLDHPYADGTSGQQSALMEVNADGTGLTATTGRAPAVACSAAPGSRAKGGAPGRSAAEGGQHARGDAAVGGDVGLAVGADLDQAGAGGERVGRSARDSRRR